MERMIEVPVLVFVIGVAVVIAVPLMAIIMDRRMKRQRAEDLLAGRAFPRGGCWTDVRRDGLWYNSDTDRVWRKTYTAATPQVPAGSS